MSDKTITGVVTWLRNWFYTKSEVDGLVITGGTSSESITDKIYPIGSIYMSVNSTSPASLFGGTWEQIQDTFLLASGTTYTNGATGGSADAVVVKHNHTQNPHNHTQNSHNHTQNAHSHGTKYNDYSYVVSETSGASNKRVTAVSSGSTYVDTSSKANFHHYNATENVTATNQAQTATNKEATATNKESGVDGTGKNMPPYLAVYMWKRIA